MTAVAIALIGTGVALIWAGITDADLVNELRVALGGEDRSAGATGEAPGPFGLPTPGGEAPTEA